MKPIIAMLIALLYALTAQSAVTTEYQQKFINVEQVQLQDAVITSAIDSVIANGSYTRKQLEQDTIERALVRLNNFGIEHDREVPLIYIINLRLVLEDAPKEGKYWLSKPSCSDPYYLDTIRLVFETSLNDKALGLLAERLGSCL